MLAAIIPAAGRSERMGRPKALLTWRGRTFLEGILEVTRAVGIERRIVVLGHHAARLRAECDLRDVVTVESEALEDGPIGSIRTGVRLLLNHPVEGALVWSVDRPHVHVETIEQIVARFRADTPPVVVPTHGGRRGHPVLFGRAVFQELLDAPADDGARAVVRRDPERVVEVPATDPAILEDVNTPEEYARLKRSEDARGDPPR